MFQGSLELSTNKEVCQVGRLIGSQAHNRIATLSPTRNGEKVVWPTYLQYGIILDI
jgi:hypothetical protein